MEFILLLVVQDNRCIPSLRSLEWAWCLVLYIWCEWLWNRWTLTPGGFNSWLLTPIQSLKTLSFSVRFYPFKSKIVPHYSVRSRTIVHWHLNTTADSMIHCADQFSVHSLYSWLPETSQTVAPSLCFVLLLVGYSRSWKTEISKMHLVHFPCWGGGGVSGLGAPTHWKLGHLLLPLYPLPSIIFLL